MSSELRVVTLGGAINGNTEASAAAFLELGDKLMLVHAAASTEQSAFSPPTTLERAEIVAWDFTRDGRELVDLVNAFKPDAVMCGGWHIPSSFRQVMRAQKPPVVRLMFMDSIWRPTLKQWVGRRLHRFLIDPFYDVAVVPGDRSEFLARRLGFGPNAIIRGAYTGNSALYDTGPRTAEELASRRRFLYVGRLVPFKGLDTLGQAYRRYRSVVTDPWELHVVGRGPEGHHLDGIEGVTMHGFVQAPDLSDLMHQASCLVLPSVSEHFGIVVHEAAAAGLPLLVSESAGAVPGLLQDGYNGWVAPELDVDAWVRVMSRMAGQSPDRLREMSDISRALSTRLSPAGYARTMHEEIEWRREALTPR